MDQKCIDMIGDQQNQGTLIDSNTAQTFLDNYLVCTGEVQPSGSDPTHIFGYVFGLNRLKEFILLIDEHNTNTDNPDLQINAVRIYRAKSQRSGSADMLSDILIMPVRRNGEDYPVTMRHEIGEKMILSGSGPCPNICSILYFFK